MKSNRSLLIAVLGPTGAGKSDLALNVAQEFGGEIVSCDSIQVYRRLDIGSAKVPVSERRGIPHHLIDILDVDEELTAGAYSRLARQVIAGIEQRRRLPIIVGGTGFYFRALVDGLSPAPGRDENLRARLGRLAKRRPAALHRILRRYDPQAAGRIHPNDHQKLIRAIELTWLARQPATKTQSAPRGSLPGVTALKIGIHPDRRTLYERLNGRTAWMFHHGLLEETRALLDAGFAPDLKPLQSLGYKQAVRVLTGQLPLDEAIRECQTRTRQYAKRQLTWFRREPGIHWLHGFGTDEPVQKEACDLIKRVTL